MDGYPKRMMLEVKPPVFPFKHGKLLLLGYLSVKFSGASHFKKKGDVMG